MTQPQNPDAREPESVKTDTKGRQRTTPEQRETLLDAYEAGALSGPAFAKAHGVNYQTFSGWMRKRRRQRENDGQRVACTRRRSIRSDAQVTLVEAIAASNDGGLLSREEGCLIVELPGGARCLIESKQTVGLAAELLRNLGGQPSAFRASC